MLQRTADDYGELWDFSGIHNDLDFGRYFLTHNWSAIAGGSPKNRVTPRFHLLVYSGEIEALPDVLYELFGWLFISAWGICALPRPVVGIYPWSRSYSALELSISIFAH